MAVSEYATRLVVVSAADLPKTDRFSKIDPYIKLLLAGQKYKTKVKQDDDSPEFQEGFTALVQKHPSGFLTGSIEVQLWDEDTFSGSMIARAIVNLETLTFDQLNKPLTYPLSLVKDKHKELGKQPTVTIKFEGLVQSYDSLRAMFAGFPGFLAIDGQRSCYIPVADSNGLLYVGLEYQNDGNLDCKVYVTRPQAPIFLDMLVLSGRQYTKVRRRQYHTGKAICPGLTAYEEIKLDDVPLSMDFNQLGLIVFDSQRLSSTNANTVVTEHGWRGSLNFGQAVSTLRNIQVDHQNEEIYMEVDPGETMLLVDYDKDDADVKLAVLASPSTADKGYDLTIRGQNVNKMSELYVPPCPKLGGRVHISRLYELDDLEYGTQFKDIEIHRYHLSNARQYTVQGITRIMG